VFHRFDGGFAAPHAVNLAARTESREALVVHTTLQPALQNRVELIIRRQLEALENRHMTQAAAVVIENKTGKILALSGSRDFSAPDGGQINGAWTPHSPGSALKPFTYLLALQHGCTAATVVPDLPIEYNTATGIYRPENYDHRNYGPVAVRTALGSSLNIPAVRLLHQIGGEKVLCEALQKAGISTLDQPPDHYGLGLTIGNAPVRLVELANAYACLARLGEYIPWTLVEREMPPAVRLFPELESYIIADILSDNQARVLTFGPHSVIRLPFRCAVKTGTSTSYRDNWTLGFTPEYTVGVWAGNFDNTPMEHISGVTGAGPMLRDIFTYLHDSSGTTWYVEPSGLVHAAIDPRLGKRVCADLPPPPMSREDLFVRGTAPPIATREDYNEDTQQAYIGREYAAWLAKGSQWLAGTVTLRPESSRDYVPLRITTPVNGTVLYLDPDLKNGGNRLQLRGTAGGSIVWSSPTLSIIQDSGASYAILQPGKHMLTASVANTGERATSAVEVISPEQQTLDKLLQSK
jgi:penicillin-binding protein 1C